MKLNNQKKHELGMIDDKSQNDSTFERMVDEFAVGRKPKYNGGRKYSAEKKSRSRAQRLAKKARQERIANEKSAVTMLNHQLLHNQINK